MEIVDQEEELSGSIVSFNGRNNTKIKSLVANIEPVQDLHGYDNPWPAGGGKNLLNATGTQENCTLSDGIYTLNTVPSSNKSFTIGSITLKAGNSYILSGGSGTNNFRVAMNVGGVAYYSSSGESSIINVTEDETTTVVGVITTSATKGSKIYPMVRISSQPSGFVPYSNICPITGHTGMTVTRTGKNLFDKTTIQAGYIDNADGQQKGQSASLNYKCTGYITVESNEQYYVKSEQTSSIWGAWYDKYQNFISGITNYANAVITAPNTAKYVRLTVMRSGNGNAETFAVNYPATDTAYHAYTGTTLPISWETEAGTVYGGSLTLNEDGSADLISEWVYRSLVGDDVIQASTYNGYGMVKIGNLGTTVNGAGMCNMLKKYSGVASSMPDFQYNMINSNGYGRDQFNFKFDFTSSSTTEQGRKYAAKLDELADAGTSLEIAYKLAEPIVYHLENIETLSTVLGTNNIWTDSSLITLEISEKGITAFELEPHI